VNHFTHLSPYLSFLEANKATIQLEECSAVAARIFNEKVLTGNHFEARQYIQGLDQNLKESEFRSLISMKMTKQMYDAIVNGRLNNLEEYWNLGYPVISSHKQAFPILSDALAHRILELTETDLPDLKQSKSYILLWKSLEKNPLRRYFMAEQLVRKAHSIWSIKGEYEKAITLIKIAETLPYHTEKNYLYEEIERTIVRSYRQAMLQDHVHEFPLIQKALNEFHLSPQRVLDQEETANQLADAQYLFHRGDLKIAADKAHWVLHVDPTNQIARRIAALTAYHEGHYHNALEHMQYLQAVDHCIDEAQAISKMLTGDISGESTLQIISQQSPLSQEVKLRLGLGYLLISQPDRAFYWLNQLSTTSDEVITGLCIAAFQKQDWTQVIHSYGKLSVDSQKIPALQGLVIQSLIAQNQLESADKLFSIFTQNTFTNNMDESKPFSILKKHLSSFNPHDFAARYYFHIKKDSENAFKSFQMIQSPSLDQRIERAELAYTLKYYSESLKDLHALQDVKGQNREKTLKLLGHIYLELGLYPDSVCHFKELFDLNKQQDILTHQAYCQVLNAIGRSDLASKYSMLSGIISFPSSTSPLEYMTMTHIPKSKRLDHLEQKIQSYPQSISMQMLLAKELISRASHSLHASEELLIAHEILATINTNHPYLPEAWVLQGQVHSHLKLHHSAKLALSRAISLSPQYAEAYKLLALINYAENDYLSAVYNFKQALKINPLDIGAWSSLASLQETQNQIEEALDAWNQAAKLDPLNPMFLIKIAQLNITRHHLGT